MLEPGRKEPTFVTSLDQVPAKAKVQLWSKGTAPSSDPPAAGSSYTLTVTKSEAVAPEGTVISVGGADLDSLRAAIGAQLGKPNIQMMIWDDDFREFCRP